MKKLVARDQGLENVILNTVRSGNYILGAEVEKFEHSLAQSQSSGDACFAVGCNSGTDALILSLLASGIRQGDQVIAPSFTAAPTVAAIIAIGAEPVFVDIDPQTWVLDIQKVGHAITARTRAVIAVHLYGNMVDVAELQTFLQYYQRGDIVVIEDVAQALGSTLQQRKDQSFLPAGRFGRFGALSFYPTKNLGALGDAGAVICANSEDAEKVRTLRNYGQSDRYHCTLSRGLNSRLDEIQASVLSYRLPRLTEDNRIRIAMTERYRSQLGYLPIRFQTPTPGCRPAWHQCVMAVENREQRDKLIAHLKDRGVQSLIHYPIPAHAQIAFRNGLPPNDSLRVTDDLSSRILSVPMNVMLQDDEQTHVISVIQDFFKPKHQSKPRARPGLQWGTLPGLSQ